MRRNDLVDAQRLVGLIEAGTASRSDLVALFIYLREQLNDQDPVKDIAHCIAHSKRDRGIAFKYIEAFIRNFINCTQKGGVFTVVVLFPLKEVIERLIQDLQGQGITVQPDSFRQQSTLFRKQIGDILDGVEIKLSNPNVVECKFATADVNSLPHFYVKFRDLERAKAIPIPPDVAMAFPVLVG
jgi:hypothetical protein